MKSLSIVVPTYNNASNIRHTLDSIKAADRSALDSFEVIVIDNNSDQNNTILYKALIEEYKNNFNLFYGFEIRQGRSHAINLGVSLASGEIIGFIDDDETLDSNWINAVVAILYHADYDYVGGACLPDWQGTAPKWLPANNGSYKGILGWIELSDHNIPFDSPGIQLCGGNFAIKKSVFNDTGLFNTNLGRSAGNLMGGEDGDFHRRLNENHKKGLYSPSLIIYHQIPTSRMTFKYHIRWAFWSGVSNGVRIKSEPDKKEDVAHFFDIPKYWYNKSIKGILQFIIETSLANIKKSPSGICGIMDFCYFFGLLYGRYFYSQK